MTRIAKDISTVDGTPVVIPIDVWPCFISVFPPAGQTVAVSYSGKPGVVAGDAEWSPVVAEDASNMTAVAPADSYLKRSARIVHPITALKLDSSSGVARVIVLY